MGGLEQTGIKTYIRKLVADFFTKHPNTKGISVYVVDPDLNLKYGYACGWADEQKRIKLKTGHPALIASITKSYLSAAVLRMIENRELGLDQSICKALPVERTKQLEDAGYNTQRITVANLLSHTSGIFDYVNTEIYQKRSKREPNYFWSRQDQINLALKYKPCFEPGNNFSYSDTNSLLLTEIIENLRQQVFYTAIRELIDFEKFNLTHTWFKLLEPDLSEIPLPKQFASEFEVNSYTLHPSFDLYGGGGLVSTTENVAQFFQLFLTGKIFNQPDSKAMIFESRTNFTSVEQKYFMGVAEFKAGKFTAFGHGGFWGTMALYFPAINSSICIFLMERDEWPLCLTIMEKIALKIEKLKV
ncbi:MAG: beta-lactamase family protein [Flavobacteriales bacterium]|nr:beta-lactamase family protein [Flavobacteriales bacterium]